MLPLSFVVGTLDLLGERFLCSNGNNVRGEPSPTNRSIFDSLDYLRLIGLWKVCQEIYQLAQSEGIIKYFKYQGLETTRYVLYFIRNDAYQSWAPGSPQNLLDFRL